MLQEQLIYFNYQQKRSNNVCVIFSYERVTSLKAINPNLKVLLGLNGWNTRFYPTNSLGLVATPSFVQDTIDFLRRRDFDGIDVDWEYSTRRRGLPTSKDGFTELLRVMKYIMQTCPCEVYPFTPHFYIVKLGFTGVHIIFLFLL